MWTERAHPPKPMGEGRAEDQYFRWVSPRMGGWCRDLRAAGEPGRLGRGLWMHRSGFRNRWRTLLEVLQEQVDERVKDQSAITAGRRGRLV